MNEPAFGPVVQAASQALRDQMRADRTGGEAFFDRGPGFAKLDHNSQGAPACDWL